MKQKNKKDEFEFFDDCPICQAMKAGKNSMKDLKKAFREAEKKGAVVGGTLFENQKNKKNKKR